MKFNFYLSRVVFWTFRVSWLNLLLASVLRLTAHVWGWLSAPPIIPCVSAVSCWALKCQSTILAHVAQLQNGALEEISHTHSGSSFTVKQSFTLPQMWLKHQRPSSPRCVSWPRVALLHGHFIYMLNTKHNTVQREFKPVPQRFWPVKLNKCASGRKVLSFTDGEADNAIPCRDDAQRWIIANGNIRQITDCQLRPTSYCWLTKSSFSTADLK